MSYLRGREVWLLVVALPLFLGANCDQDHDPDVPDQARGDFPSVNGWWNQHNGHNADRRAFSVDGQDVEEVAWHPNGGAPGTGILFFTTDPIPEAAGDDEDSDAEGPVFDDDGDEGDILWASYVRNGAFTPPVEIFGQNQEDASEVLVDRITTIWLNEPTNPNRNGDAVVLYARRSAGVPDDMDDSGTEEDEGNVRLYSCYFDVSESGRPVGQGLDGSTMLYGFSSLATFVDGDPSGDDDDRDSDVTSFGVVSDGLCFSSEFTAVDGGDDDGDGPARSGDPTTFVYAVWTQEVESGSDTADEPVGRRLWFSQFDLSGSTTRFDTAQADFVSDTATVALENEDEVGTDLVVHNGFLVWTLDTDPADAASNDEYLFSNTFSESGVSTTSLLSRQDDDSFDRVEPADPSAKNLYGDDHGLVVYAYYFEEGGFDSGNLSSETDLMVAFVDLAGAESETLEIDEFRSGPDETPVVPGSTCTAISRSGGHILAAWRQPHLTSSEASGSNTSPTLSLFVRVVDTALLDTDPEAATSGGTGNHTALRLNQDVVDVETAELGRDVREFGFQKGLADGTSDPGTVFQSDRFTFHVLFTQDMSDSGTDLVTLHTASASVDPNDVDTLAASDRLVDTVDRDWLDTFPYLSPTQGAAQSLDDGDGDVVVYYLNQGNNQNDAGSDGEEPTTVVGVILDCDFGPFLAGTFIELDRLDLNTVGSGPECTRGSGLHVHSLDPTVGITIDGQGPFPEPLDKFNACGYGLVVAMTVGGGSGTSAFDERRLYAWTEESGPLEISSDGSSFGGGPDFNQVQEFECTQTPCDANTQRSPDAGPRFHHLFLFEDHSNTEPHRLRHRVLDLDSSETDLGNQFSPAASDPPEAIDLGRAGDVDASSFVSRTEGTVVEIYMLVDGHVYWNRYDGNRWRTRNGLPDPALVDHDSSVNTEAFAVLDASGRRGCQTLRSTPVIWVKRDFSDPEDRLSLRVRR